MDGVNPLLYAYIIIVPILLASVNSYRLRIVLSVYIVL